MSEDQFQVWVHHQMRSVTGKRLGNQDEDSLQQCDELFQEWGQYRQRVDQHEDALREIVQAQRVVRQQLLTALSALNRGAEAVDQPIPEVARFQPVKKASLVGQRSSVPAPSSAPIVGVLAPNLCQHVITFRFAGGRGSQPVGSSGAEIYIALGDERPLDDAFRFAAWATRSPHLLQFSESDAGRTAHYRLRWINAKGETGPWSEIASAVIPVKAELV